MRGVRAEKCVYVPSIIEYKFPFPVSTGKLSEKEKNGKWGGGRKKKITNAISVQSACITLILSSVSGCAQSKSLNGSSQLRHLTAEAIGWDFHGVSPSKKKSNKNKPDKPLNGLSAVGTETCSNSFCHASAAKSYCCDGVNKIENRKISVSTFPPIFSKLRKGNKKRTLFSLLKRITNKICTIPDQIERTVHPAECSIRGLVPPYRTPAPVTTLAKT